MNRYAVRQYYPNLLRTFWHHLMNRYAFTSELPTADHQELPDLASHALVASAFP